MEGISFSLLAKPLITIGNALKPQITQLRAQRQAGANATPVRTDFFDRPFDDTIDRLANIDKHDSWWRDLLRRAQSAYITPDYLAKPSIREWLNESEVRRDLKTLARASLMPTTDGHSSATARLADRYAAHTGEAPSLGVGAIEAIVNIMLAGILSPTTDGELVIAGLIQGGQQQQAAQFEELKALLTAPKDDDVVVEVHTQRCQAELERILRRRSIPLVDARTEIAALAESIEGQGNLLQSAKPVKAQVYLWAARLHASVKDKVEIARQYKAKALALDPGLDTTIVDAWISATTGDVDAGLRLLRERNSADARSSLVAMLVLNLGRKQAIAWIDAQKPIGHDFLTAVGWRNAVPALAEEGRWEDAAGYLVVLPEAMKLDCPDLPFIEGVINAALTLPAWVRPFALSMNIMEPQVETLHGDDVTARRERARTCFEAAIDSLMQVGGKARADVARAWRTWVLLTDPKTRSQGEALVLEAMREWASAIDHAPLAYAFQIKFDTAPLENYLCTRELSGGLSQHEMAAKLALYRNIRRPSEILRFLEDERNALASVLTPLGHTFLLITVLADAGQLERAEQLLLENRDAFADNYDRLADQIRLRRGDDVIKSFEDRFLATNEELDLLVLCDNLGNGQDVDKLHRYALILFQRQRNLRNAKRVCDALLRLENHSGVVEFLSAAADLVAMDIDLASIKAWSEFFIGKLNDAKRTNDRLRQIRDDAADGALEVNLAIAMGAWEEFGGIIDSEWARRDRREPRYLLQLAHLATDVNADRAIELVREAVQKAATDPELLANASVLAYRLGQDADAMPLAAEAARLSPPDAGPVKTANVREMVDMLFARGDATRGVEEAFAAARIPIHGAASLWRTSLTRLLVGQPIDNERQPDPRHRTIVPIRHGARGILDVTPIRKISADVTSLLLLSGLDLLPALQSRFDQINVAWSTMEFLLQEHQSTRFHQPSRVASAKRCRELFVNKTFVTVAVTFEPPSALIQEVGRELAELLHEAKRVGGRVVRPLPIYRVNSFMEKTAELGEYAQLVVTTLQFIDLLETDAVLDSQTSKQARLVLGPMEQGEPLGPGTVGDGPLFIDGLALAYLSGAGLLPYLERSGRQFELHPATLSEVEQLIHTEIDSERSIEILSRLRLWLHDGIVNGRIKVLPQYRVTDSSFGIETRLLQEIIGDLGEADALLMDDRMIGALFRATDRAGRSVPIMDTVDALADFARQGLISQDERWNRQHVLRSRGFVCVPIEQEEIQAYLAKATLNQATGVLREGAELRAINQNLHRLRSSTILQQPAETIYLDRLRITGLATLHSVWGDASLPLPVAVARSNWLWRNLLLSPVDWAHTIIDSAGVVAPLTGFINELVAILAIPVMELERRYAYRDWIETTILAPLELASSEVLRDLAVAMHARIRGWVHDWADEN